MVAHTSIAKATLLGTQLELAAASGTLGPITNPDRILVVSSTTNSADSPKVTAFLRKPGDEMVHYDVVIITPTMQAGQSIDQNSISKC
jgi:hypothetical protein